MASFMARFSLSGAAEAFSLDEMSAAQDNRDRDAAREGRGGYAMTPRACGRLADHRTISGFRARTLLRRLGAALLSVAAFALADTARAASYYFSNCATGGAGTQANPYCLDPTGSGNKTSFRYLMDGASPDVAPGDTIYLCAGACDGAGSGTYNLGVAGTANNGWTYVFAPVISGTASAPITIAGYPGETVVLSGDTNANGIPEANEPATMITNVTPTGANRQWYIWKNFTVERLQEAVFFINMNPANWTFDNVEVRYFDAQMWNGGTVFDNGCNDQGGGYVFKVADLAGPLTIKNSRFHHICGFVNRITVNPSSGSILFENNEYYNVSIVDNEFQSRNITWRGNYLHDFYDGISMEDDMQNVVIEDNVIACPGDYKVGSDGRCFTGITVNDGNNTSATAGKTKNITIRRNRVYGNIDGQWGSTTSGYFLCPVTITATNNTEPINIVLENNFIWHALSWSEDPVCSAGIGVKTNRSEVTIQNNTLYDTSNGIYLDGTVPGLAYTVRNNLVVKSGKGSTNRPEVTVTANAAGSIIKNNNLHHGGQGDPVMRIDATSYTCAQIPTVQTGNKCQATTFVRTSSTVKDWDLHLATTDVANRNAGTTGATDDIDKTTRATPIDIGADEMGGAGVTATLALQSGGQPVPSLNGMYLLKAGTYTVTLTSSVPVVLVPTPLTLTTSGGATVLVVLAGAVPGTQFSGSFTVGTATAEGNGTFTLAALSLDDGQGNKGQLITSGASVLVDRTPPAPPTGVRTQ
jgi:hypothetical protein